MGTGKTGGHWKPCNIGSVEAHNERRPDYLEAVKNAGLNLYFFQHLTNKNSHWVSSHDRYSGKTVAEVFDAMKKLYTEKTGQPPQLTEKIKKNKKTGKEYKCAGWSPIREMCVPIKEDTKVEDFNYLKKWAEKYGIEIIRIDLHKDEGYHDQDTGEYKMNYHAHVVASFLDWNTGKTVKPNKEAMSEMQTVLAMALDMERGQRKADTGREYLDHNQYREMREAVDGEKEKVIAELADKQQQLDTVNAELAKVAKKIKGLSTMLANLEGQRQQPLQEMAELEEKADRGEITPEDLEKLTRELSDAISLIESKIADKKAKLDEGMEQVRELAMRKHKLQNSYDDLMRQFYRTETALQRRKDEFQAECQSLADRAVKQYERVQQELKEKRAEIGKMDKTGELAKAQKHIEERDAVLYRHWPEARDAVAAICSLGNSNIAKDFTPQQALDVEKAIARSGIARTDAAKDLLTLARKSFDNHRTPQAWVAAATAGVMSIANGTHQRLSALLRQQPKDAGGGPSYITDLTDWAGNQIRR